MDENNKKAMNVYNTEGYKAFEKYVFTHPSDHDKPTAQQLQLSYSEMRMLYG